MKIVSSNKATLKIPVLPFGENPSPHPEDGTTANPPTPIGTLNPSSATRRGSSSGSDSENGDGGSGREKEDGEGDGAEGEQTNTAENGASAAKGLLSNGGAFATAVPQVWSEGRTTWKGETLTALRTPLFVVEIAVVGEKGSEVFVYTQRLSAVKESALALIDKAIASTQVSLSLWGRWRRRWRWRQGVFVNFAHMFWCRRFLHAQTLDWVLRYHHAKNTTSLFVCLDRVVVSSCPPRTWFGSRGV